ncbi:MAG TPA: DNA (cytosine-5-)-methyltransferase [Gemmatimonadaceae bacterium]|nr:DNA (cytosine-5-)-methyltransferase [Gemmatimonadaceae bacterium]
MQVVHAVPPGGNWKDVPLDVPGKRLETIRQSYAAGEGSRSTYYGRLRPDRPSYTINTYFSRPGNGCHIHYSQDRVISQREAARLQSFPDSFVFQGPQTAINTQIGNAVPPLLAYQIARTLGEPGCFIELFSGAGGMSLGFTWAGWHSTLASDIDASALSTHERNLHDRTILGDIRDQNIFDKIIEGAQAARAANPKLRFWVLGGPPCQGFSTAGKPRSMADERNHLVWHYKRVLDALQPEGFVFENVTGLLNIDGGRTFREVRAVLGSTVDVIGSMVLAAEEFGVPQRRSRVLLIGRRGVKVPPSPPQPLTIGRKGVELFSPLLPPVSAEEALCDLPALVQGQDGSHLSYAHEPSGPYQLLMRNRITPDEFVSRMRGGVTVIK